MFAHHALKRLAWIFTVTASFPVLHICLHKYPHANHMHCTVRHDSNGRDVALTMHP